MVPIHKKSKDQAKMDSYHLNLISLTSCVGKLMERMINTRLARHLEKNNIITPTQVGFWQHCCPEHQVTYIAQKTENGFQDKKHTLTVWVDMDKVYKVWKDGLHLKLQKSGVTRYIYQWIYQYLTKRKARVQVNQTYTYSLLQEDTERRKPWRYTAPYLIPSLHTGHLPCKVQEAICWLCLLQITPTIRE